MYRLARMLAVIGSIIFLMAMGCADAPATSAGTDAVATGSAITDGSHPTTAKADVDCDGDIDAVDALKEMRYIAGLPLSQTEPCLAIGTSGDWVFGDVDCDDDVDAVDTVKILRHIATLPIPQQSTCGLTDSVPQPTPAATPAPTPTPTASPTPADPGPMAEACPEPEEGVQSQLYEHRVQWAHSEDGVRFQSDGHVLLEHASVPDGVRRDDGATWVYYVNGVPGQHAVFIARLEGEQLVPFECLRLDGEVVGDAVDPDIVALPEGGYRLFYFLGWFTPENRPPPGGAPHPMYSAVSADGVHFEVEQVQLTLDSEGTDPTVVRLPSGRWLMAVTARERVVLASTDTGDDFALTEHEFPQGISELAYFPEAQVVRLFISGHQQTVNVWESADEGETWKELPMVNIPGPDPSVVPDGEGGWTMFYKSFAR